MYLQLNEKNLNVKSEYESVSDSVLVFNDSVMVKLARMRVIKTLFSSLLEQQREKMDQVRQTLKKLYSNVEDMIARRELQEKQRCLWRELESDKVSKQKRKN